MISAEEYKQRIIDHFKRNKASLKEWKLMSKIILQASEMGDEEGIEELDKKILTTTEFKELYENTDDHTDQPPNKITLSTTPTPPHPNKITLPTATVHTLSGSGNHHPVFQKYDKDEEECEEENEDD